MAAQRLNGELEAKVSQLQEEAKAAKREPNAEESGIELLFHCPFHAFGIFLLCFWAQDYVLSHVFTFRSMRSRGAYRRELADGRL